LDLLNWPDVFSGRSILHVVGATAGHGPFGIGAATADVLAMVDMVMAEGYNPASWKSILDTEAINEAGPPWAQSWKPAYAT